MPDVRGSRKGGVLTRKEWGFLVVWTLVASAAYLYQIDARSLWLDEVMSVNVAGRSWPEMWSFFQGLPEQHPLYYLVLGAWQDVFGTGEAAVRSLSGLFALAGGWLSYLLARRLFGRRVAVITAAILLVSPFWLYFAQEARMYTLLGFLAVASHLLFLRWRDGHDTAAWGYVLVGVLGAYTHLFFLFVPLAHLVFTLDEHRDFGPEVRRRAVAVAVIGIAYLPWAWLILTHMPEGQGWKGMEHVVMGLPYTLVRFSVGYSELIPVAGWKQEALRVLTENGLLIAGVAVAFGGLLAAGTLSALQRGTAGRFVLLGVVVPVVVMYALSTVTVVVGERYLVIIYPLFALLVAAGVERLVFRGSGRRVVVGGLLAVVAIGLSVKSVAGYYMDDVSAKASWRQAAAFVADRARQGDHVLFHEDFVDGPFDYYYNQLRAPGLTDAREGASSSSSAAEGLGRTWVIVSHAPAGSRCIETIRGEGQASGIRVLAHRRFPSGAGIDVFLVDLGAEGSSSDRRVAGPYLLRHCPA